MDLYTESNNRFFRLFEEIGASPSSNRYLKGFEFGSLDDALKELPKKAKKMTEADIDIRKGMITEPIEDPSKLKDKEGESKLPAAARTSRLLHDSTVKGFLKDDEKTEWDLEALKKLLVTRPNEMLNQNSKMEKSGGDKYVFFNFSIPAYHGIYYNEKDNEFELVRTCPHAGACKYYCYAVKGFYLVFPAPALKAAQNLTFLINHPEEFKNQLISEIKKKQAAAKRAGKEFIVRWHDSGDAFNEAYMNLIFDIAKGTPDVRHYTYTKQVEQFKNAKLPDNFTVNFSYGGTTDKEINPDDRQSILIKKPLFKDLDLDKEEDVDKLKDAVAKEHNIDRKTIIAYPELMKMPEGNERKWNVLVWHGHGDDSAVRKDVLKTLLLEH